MAIELYEHNQETYESIKEMLECEDRVAVVQPTGTGKSFLFLKWIEDNANDVFVVVSPSNEIFNQLERYAKSTGDGDILRNTEFISYQTLNNMTDEEMSKLMVDKLILDEYHRAGAAQWGPSLQRFFDMHPDIKLLGATATPIRYLDKYKDMTEVLFNGQIARYMTLGEAIVKGILPAPVYVQVWNEDDARVGEYQERIEALDMDEERVVAEKRFAEWKRHLEMAYGPEKMFKEHMPNNHGKFIVFCSDVEHLDLMKEKMVLWLRDVNSNIHSYVSITRNADKDVQLEAFIEDQDAAAIKLLFSIDRFNEGLHVPELDGVIMLRPTTSPIIYLQQIGRALACGSKKVPVIFDVVNNYQNSIASLEGGAARNALEREIGEFVESVKERGEGGDIRVQSFSIFSLAAEFVQLFGSFEDYLLPLELRWYKRFANCERFVEVNGRLPNFKETFKDDKVGAWLVTQKQQYMKGKLKEDRVHKLRSLGVVLETRACRSREEWIGDLRVFVELYGRPPMCKEFFRGFNLGNFLDAQKSLYKEGRLTEDQIVELRGIGVVLERNCKVPWKVRFANCEGFVEVNGRLPNIGETFNDDKVGAFLHQQKVLFKDGKLPMEREEALRSLGVSLKAEKRKKKTWWERYSFAKGFSGEYGRLPKRGDVFNEDKVGDWLSDQKKLYRKGKLSEEKAEALRKLGVVLEVESSS